MVDVVKCSLDWTWTREPSPAASPGLFFSKNLISMSSIDPPPRRDLEMDWLEGRRGERVRVSRVTETTTLDDLHPFNGMCVDQGTTRIMVYNGHREMSLVVAVRFFPKKD